MKKVSLKMQAYTALKENIIHGIYAPGQYLNENILMEELQIGRTPIKDALGRLEQEGLIIIKPKKGIVVAPLTLQDVNMIFEMRLLFEPYILKNYGSRISEEDLTYFYHIFSDFNLKKYTDDQDKYYQLDTDFHNIIIMASPNSFIHRCYNMVQTQSERFRFMTGNYSEKRIADTFTEHLKIVEPLLEKDWNTAAEEMIIHLNASKPATLKSVMTSLDHLSIM